MIFQTFTTELLIGFIGVGIIFGLAILLTYVMEGNIVSFLIWLMIIATLIINQGLLPVYFLILIYVCVVLVLGYMFYNDKNRGNEI
jgi:hypothetical protein